MKKINICALLIITAILTSCGNSGETTLSQLTQETQAEGGAQIAYETDPGEPVKPAQVTSGTDSASGAASGTSSAENAPATPATIFVYVCGCVENPGVYELPADSRVCDALDAAGGFSEGADESRINLAGLLTDGDMVFFPKAGENLPDGASDYIASGAGSTGNAGSTGTAQSLVNINTAGEDALCTLPGIGPSKARAIIGYREEHGCFKDIREIMNVSGIGENLFKQIEDLICV